MERPFVKNDDIVKEVNLMIVTDVHMHIIPGVDDGSKSIQESITLLQRSVAQGVGTVIATPHSWAIDRCGVEYMLSRFEDLKRAVNELEISVQLFLVQASFLTTMQ